MLYCVPLCFVGKRSGEDDLEEDAALLCGFKVVMTVPLERDGSCVVTLFEPFKTTEETIVPSNCSKLSLFSRVKSLSLIFNT